MGSTNSMQMNATFTVANTDHAPNSVSLPENWLVNGENIQDSNFELKAYTRGVTSLSKTLGLPIITINKAIYESLPALESVQATYQQPDDRRTSGWGADTAQGDVQTGYRIVVTARFDGIVLLDTRPGKEAPKLKLVIGNETKELTLTGGRSYELKAYHTVTAADRDGNGVSLAENWLANAGNITDENHSIPLSSGNVTALTPHLPSTPIITVNSRPEFAGASIDVTIYNLNDFSQTMPAATSPTGSALTYRMIKQRWTQKFLKSGASEENTELMFDAPTRALSRDAADTAATTTVYRLEAVDSEGWIGMMLVNLAFKDTPKLTSAEAFYERASENLKLSFEQSTGDAVTGQQIIVQLRFSDIVALDTGNPPVVRLVIGGRTHEIILTGAGTELRGTYTITITITITHADSDADGVSMTETNWLVNAGNIRSGHDDDFEFIAHIGDKPELDAGSFTINKDNPRQVDSVTLGKGEQSGLDKQGSFYRLDDVILVEAEYPTGSYRIALTDGADSAAYIELNIGGRTRRANAAGITGDGKVQFRYTLQAGDAAGGVSLVDRDIGNCGSLSSISGEEVIAMSGTGCKLPATAQWSIRVRTTRNAGDPDLDRDDDGLIDISRPEQLALTILDADGDGTPDMETDSNRYYGVDGFPNIASVGDRSAGCPGGCRGYELLNDIDLSAASELIGSGLGGYDRKWKTLLEGNGHRISGLKLSGKESEVGLFRHIGTGGEVRNLGFVNPDVSGDSIVGVIAGVSLGVIENVYIENGRVSAASHNAGLLAGQLGDPGGSGPSRITDFWATGIVSVPGNQGAGSAVGMLYGSITNGWTDAFTDESLPTGPCLGYKGIARYSQGSNMAYTAEIHNGTSPVDASIQTFLLTDEILKGLSSFGTSAVWDTGDSCQRPVLNAGGHSVNDQSVVRGSSCPAAGEIEEEEAAEIETDTGSADETAGTGKRPDTTVPVPTNGQQADPGSESIEPGEEEQAEGEDKTGPR